MSKTYKSKILASVHETAAGLSDAGLIDKKTMREFDEACLTSIEEITPEDIKAIRLKAQVSQAVFAHYLNVSPGIVSQWERGAKHPSGASLKLLMVVRKRGLEVIA